MRTHTLLLAGLLALGTACSTLARVNGARTLEPGQAAVGASGSLQKGSNPISAGLLPLPQGEVYLRLGLRPNLDLGARAYLVGAGVDLRYRFYHDDRWHLAVNPGVSAVVLPTRLLGAGGGSFDLRTPIIAEYELNPWSSLSAGPTLVLRRQRNSFGEAALGDSGRLLRLDAYVGGGARYELHPKQWILGVNADLYAQPARHAGPAWAVGVDVGMRSRPPGAEGR